MFARLTTSVFENRNTRIVVRKVCTASVLFYSSDTWNLFSRRLSAFQFSSLRRILCINWSDFVSNAVVLTRAQLPSLSILLQHRRLRWLGYVHRMPDRRILKVPLYGEYAAGFKGVCKRDMWAMRMGIKRLEGVTNDR